MNFSEALEVVKRGGRASRKGWNSKKQYIELASNISYKDSQGEIVNCDHRDTGNKAIAFVGTSGVQLGWLASQADMLAEDWEPHITEIVEYRGFFGRINYFPDDLCYYGTLLNIEDRVIFCGDTVSDVLKNFREEVDDYISFQEHCRDEFCLKGKWVRSGQAVDAFIHHECSNCGALAPFSYGDSEIGFNEGVVEICPSCKAEMDISEILQDKFGCEKCKYYYNNGEYGYTPKCLKCGCYPWGDDESPNLFTIREV